MEDQDPDDASPGADDALPSTAKPGSHPVRVFGRLSGQITIRPGFDEADEEIAQEFNESIERPIDP